MTRLEIRKAALAIVDMRTRLTPTPSRKQEQRKEPRKRLEAYRTAISLTRLLDDAPDAKPFELVI